MFDASAIQELAKAQAITAADEAINTEGVVGLPNDYAIHDIEKYQNFRRRARGTMTTTSFETFADYCQAHMESGACVFISQDTMQAVGVLNLGTPSEPGHADNRAVLELKKTAAYSALLSTASGRALKQSEVAEFLEDWPEEIQCFADAEQLSPQKAVAAVRKITIEALRKVEASEQQLSASRSAFESVQASSTETLPTTIYFNCVPFHHLAPRLFVLRLAVQSSGDKPAITLRIVTADKHAEEMAGEVLELVQAQVAETMPVFVGQYTAK